MKLPVFLVVAALSLTLAFNGCTNCPEDDSSPDYAAPARDTLSQELAFSYEAFGSVGLDQGKRGFTIPQVEDEVLLYGYDTRVIGEKGSQQTRPLETLLDDVWAVEAGDTTIDAGKLGQLLVGASQTPQTDPLLNAGLSRFALATLGYGVLAVECYGNAKSNPLYQSNDRKGTNPFYEEHCKALREFGGVTAGFPSIGLLTDETVASFDAFADASTGLISTIETLAADAGKLPNGAPSSVKTMLDTARTFAKRVAAMGTQKTSFASRVQAGVSSAAGVLATGARSISEATDPVTTEAEALKAKEKANRLMSDLGGIETALDTDYAGLAANVLPPEAEVQSLDSSVTVGLDDLRNTTVQGLGELEDKLQNWNHQYLALRSATQLVNSQYKSVSNVMKTKHDTVKNSINNVR